MSPTIGRTVHYVNPSGSVTPAIITFVHTDTCVNLSVIQEGHQMLDPKSSVVYGDQIDNWHWPLRAEGSASEQ